MQALFCSSLPHPGTDKDYALYEVGIGCEVSELVPGIDLLSEAFRSNGRSVVASLRWITEELARGRYLLTVSHCNLSSSVFTCIITSFVNVGIIVVKMFFQYWYYCCKDVLSILV